MRTFFLAAAATIALASATAMAQKANDTDTKMNPTMNPAAGSNTNEMKTTAADVPAKGPDFISLQNSDMLNSNVVGLDIYNERNNNIGKIQDVAFDSSMKITGYILSVGGFLGMGTHYVAVDPGAVSIRYDAGNNVWRASMNATKDQLKSAPEFKYGAQWSAGKS
jgi:sporulation protein YlmC with PRC-barrel domain